MSRKVFDNIAEGFDTKLRKTLPKELVDTYHDIVVEQCAQVCDDHFGGTLFAEAIRKLKFK